MRAPESLPIAAVDTLLALSDAVAHATRPDEVLDRIVTAAVDILGLPWSALMLRDPQTHELRLVATHGVALEQLPAVLQLPSAAHVNVALFGGAPLILDDYRGGPPLSPVWWEPAARLGMRAILSVAVPEGDDYLGSLHVAGPQPHPFSATEVALLERLARLAGQLLVHTRALNAAEQRAGALESIQAVVATLTATLDLDVLLHSLVERAVELTGATGGLLLLWDEEAGRLVTRQASNAPRIEDAQVAPGQGVTGTAFANGRSQIQNSYLQFAAAIPVASEERVTNVLAVPLLRQGRPFGVITVFSKVFNLFSEEDAGILTLFASQAAVAIDNGVLYTTVARQQRQLDSIIQALPDGLIVYDRAARVTLINPAAREILSLTADVVGVDRAELLRDPGHYARYQIEAVHDWARTFATVLEQGVTLGGRTRIHSEPERTVESFYTPYYDDAGAAIGVIAVFRDISAMQELELLRGELEIARRQDDFLAIASHELRTPVTAIKGYADLLARRLAAGVVATERDGRMLASIVQQVARLSALIDDLLDVSRIQAGRIDLRAECCPISAVVGAALAHVRPLAGPREDDLRLAGDDALVICDPERLEQVFVNLLTNALKYSSHGPITCTIQAADARVQVAVQDNGTGIAGDDQARIFERFFRSHDVYTHQRGLGLGLYISRQIVERHRGRIWVESEVGRGSTFYVELPRAPEGNDG